MTKPKYSALFRHIESLQGDRPWGSLLDAGTGVNSIRWISSLTTERWTAVTGSSDEAARVTDATTTTKRPQDQIVHGNWADLNLLHGETYDTVIADYLLGAVEGFAPYLQASLFLRLRPLTRSTIYITSLEPYVPTGRPDAAGAEVIWEIGRFRDACMLLAGTTPYREYPAAWVIDQLQRSGFAVRDVKHFAIQYKERFVNAQIDLCTPGLTALEDRALAQSLADRGEVLREKALQIVETEGALRGCRNYVISARPN